MEKSNENSIDEFVWESGSKSAVRVGGNNYSVHWIKKKISVDRFNFRIKISQISSFFHLGICNWNVRTGFTNFGRTKWSLQQQNGVVMKRAENTCTTVRSLTRIVNGDIITFHVNRSKGTITVEKDFKYCSLICGAILPEDLAICFAAYGGHGIEFVSFEDADQSCESMERLNFLVNDLPNFDIHLQNKDLKVWKPLFANSNIINLEHIKDFKGLSNLTLFVDETTIFSLIMELKCAIDNSSLFDYYQFFQRLGMFREMKNVIERIPKIENFEELYLMFEKISTKHEDHDISEWFNDTKGGPCPAFTRDTFKSAFSLTLFNEMRKRRGQMDSFSNLFFKFRSFGRIFGQLTNYSQQDEVPYIQHCHFEGYNLEDRSLKKLMEKLKEGKLTNVKLISSDGEEFLCQREILVFRANFFYLMMKFKGAEWEQMTKNGEIKLEFIPSVVLKDMLEFIYTEEMEETDLEVIIRLLIHSDMYSEESMFFFSIWLLSRVPINGNHNVREILQNLGHMVHGHDKIRDIVVPELVKLSKNDAFVKETILCLMKEAFDKEEGKDMKEKEEMKKENEELKVVNVQLREEIESLKKSVDEPVLGGGVRRKRENDDEDAEQEKPKKKRKVQQDD